ncbi:MAG: carbon storage regulator CsrA [Planctomycetota bacterium]|nr:carbon storage regulator CsrA [Planctomycetota bacterium]
MLVLTRKKNESIVIAGNIRVTVLSTGGGQIRLGIEAPPEIPIHREEVHEQLRRSEKIPSPGTSDGETDPACFRPRGLRPSSCHGR